MAWLPFEKWKPLTPPILRMFAQQRVWAWPWNSCHNEKLSSPTFGRSPWEVSCHSRNERNNLCKKWKLKKLWRHNTFCVTLINFLPLIKRVSELLIKEKLFRERERGEKRFITYQFFYKGHTPLIATFASLGLQTYELYKFKSGA